MAGMHSRVPSHLSDIHNAALSRSRELKSVTLDQYWRDDDQRDWCNRSLMIVASDLTTITCLDPDTAASLSNRELLIERGVAVMQEVGRVDSNYIFLPDRDRQEEVDEYTVFWTIKDYFPTLAVEARRLLHRGRKEAMEAERSRTPYNPFSPRACEKIAEACRTRGARSLTLYGSYADGTQSLRSKIDFLAEMNPRLHPDRQSRTRIDLQFDLEEILGGPVWISNPSWIWDPYHKDSIENCSVPLYSREDPTFRAG